MSYLIFNEFTRHWIFITKHNDPLDVHWMYTECRTFTGWSMDIHKIKCATWGADYQKIIKCNRPGAFNWTIKNSTLSCWLCWLRNASATRALFLASEIKKISCFMCLQLVEAKVLPVLNWPLRGQKPRDLQGGWKVEQRNNSGGPQTLGIDDKW